MIRQPDNTMASTKPSRVYGVAFTIVLNWIGSVRLMHAQPWISHPGPRLGKLFDAGCHRFDKRGRLAHHLRKIGSLAPLEAEDDSRWELFAFVLARSRRCRRSLSLHPNKSQPIVDSPPAEMSSSKPLKIPLFRLASGRTQVDDRLGLSLQKLAQSVPFRHIPHRHDFYHVAWIEGGSGTFFQDGHGYPIKQGSLIFVPPAQVHTWEAKKALLGYILSFEPTLLFSQSDRPYRLLHVLTEWSAAVKTQIQVTGASYEWLRSKFEDLTREFCGNGEFRDEMLRSQITGILISLHRFSTGSGKKGNFIAPTTMSPRSPSIHVLSLMLFSPRPGNRPVPGSAIGPYWKRVGS